MEIKVTSGDITEQAVDAIVVNLFDGVAIPGGATGSVDQALEGAVNKLISDGEIKGKTGHITMIHTLGKMVPARILVVGLGDISEFSADTVRRVSAETCRYLRRVGGVQRVATVSHGAGIGGMDAASSAQAIAEGAILGLYSFHKYKSIDDGRENIEELTIVEFDESKLAALRHGLSRGVILAEATNLCRGMVNEPANYMTPTRMVEVSVDVAEDNDLQIDVLERAEMADLGMGALLGVAQGSDEPPKLIILRYHGDREDQSNSLCLLGKGICFDSGGISLKPAANMGAMKGDMAGGAAVISAMKAIGEIKPKINVTAIIPATENMPGGKAQRPGDVVKVMNGKSIEIDNTDAEGRLVLADALCYARSLGLDRIVDVATLTGAMVIALGNVCTGVFGNDQYLIDKVIEAGMKSGEKLWPMPNFEEYKEQFKSDVADIKNTGGREAGSVTGAQIIGEFAEGASWVHLDIAGTARANCDRGYNTKGSTGVPVRTLVSLIMGMAKA